ncbi:zinc finger protein 706-like [Vulpes lagopus]|uniref:zinc finger protein 706-like n=1 Tax=Vulpes lagopus TaxID=494514 RepID=UPI001BC8D8AD|nr:zinc finger protein 706-like [Vulpes lagopus]
MRVTGGTRHVLLWSPLSLPWWVEVVEVVLGALPLPLPQPPPPALSHCTVSLVSLMQDCQGPDIAWGQQKIQYQQKNAQKQAGQKRKQAHDQKASAKATLIYTWTVCRTQMQDPKAFKQHFENKHPKTPLSLELADIQA